MMLTEQQHNAAIYQALAAAEVLGAARIAALPSNWHAHLASCRRVGPEPRMSQSDLADYKADQRYDAMKCGEAA